MCSCRLFCRWLPVCFVLALITWCYFEYTFDILVPMLQLTPGAPPTNRGSHDQGVAYTAVFNTLFAIAMMSFAGAVVADPGRIPDSWIVGNEDSEAGPLFPPDHTTVEVKRELTADGRGQRRICRKSKPQVYKPDRSHYCKMLSRCVLKMDHFCPWLNNCIGFYNHKYFYLFILYMAVITVFMIATMTPIFVYDVTSIDDEVIDFTTEFRVTLTYLVLCLLSIGLVCFCGFHTYLLVLNYTTIEFLEKRGCNPDHDYINPYHLGVYGNICSVMGANPLVWLLPVRWTCEGDGLSFNLNPDWFPTAKISQRN
jgi:hypothetical protein